MTYQLDLSDMRVILRVSAKKLDRMERMHGEYSAYISSKRLNNSSSAGQPILLSSSNL